MVEHLYHQINIKEYKYFLLLINIDLNQVYMLNCDLLMIIIQQAGL